jgi:hypothetical protein
MALQQILLATAIAAAGGGGGGATMNPLDKNANIALSGGDLTVSKSAGAGAWHSVRSTNGHADGFYYFEAQCAVKDASGGHIIGIMPSSDPLTQYPGQGAQSTGWYFASNGSDRSLYQAGSNRGNSPTPVSAGGYAGFAVRLNSTTGEVRVWVRTSNIAGWWGGGDPSLNYSPSFAYTGTTGLTQYMAASLYGATDSMNVNLGGAAFNMAKPVGAAAWQDSAAPTYADAFWDKTAMLLEFTGVDGAVAVTDLTGRHTSFTFAGNAQIDTGDSDFSSGALLLDGSGDYIYVSDNLNDFVIPAALGDLGDFTIEFWQKPSSVSGTRSFAGNYAGSSSGWRFGFNTGGANLQFREADSEVHDRATTISANVREHVAVCRSGTTTRIFKGGVQVGADITSLTGALGNTNSLAVGALSTSYPGNENYAGWLSYMRVTRAARYTANFTPPSTPYPTV